MMKIARGSTGYFVVELFENNSPTDLPEGTELTYTVSTKSGKSLKFRATTKDGSLVHIGVGIYSCNLPYGVSKNLSEVENAGELAAWLPDKSVVNIGQNAIEIIVTPNTINAQL